MCIVLLTTAHPKYALVVLDNRDEYILRPTSRPHWWTAKVESQGPDGGAKRTGEVNVLSSRDLYRAERGTWLGITEGGNFAVLTNYRESDTHDAAHPVAGQRSRGGMVTAWLAADPAESTEQFVHRMLHNGGVKGVGGFSLVCGKLRRAKGKNIEPLAIISNRCDHAGHVPWICGERGSVQGLSNTIYVDPSGDDRNNLWPKIRDGTDLLRDAVAAAGEGASQEEFVASLFNILDVDKFPSDHTIDLEEGLSHSKDSIFIPAFGGRAHQHEMSEAQRRGNGNLRQTGNHSPGDEALTMVERPDAQPNGFEKGLYGTQRQTVILVDWDGNVTYIERALWDCNGNPIPRGEGDQSFQFKIQGWEQDPELRN
ncbi:uncharacterized protein THITE_2169679 [Thermothielavioides terrestris NRRL 8126]|uniref:DUF833-domain-containing protein n=1 Tax=Thermothielavioides terrestris (strain ATCC 38088 / NRRL 8126) TaxID=578455 RepID=G2QT75_THETT|nr:uncharacterized protein THITE_2169679 [Thermothielavioides terrestris NRRL 8126]AEO64401.1 hypothetical protein THITE_2169679 [Thermothielavioides terrestris NRRL 8126]